MSAHFVGFPSVRSLTECGQREAIFEMLLFENGKSAMLLFTITHSHTYSERIIHLQPSVVLCGRILFNTTANKKTPSFLGNEVRCVREAR